MKTSFITMMGMLSCVPNFAQSNIKDNAVLHQEQRMVYQNWDQKKFDPTSGFLGLNPYYWLVWGFFYPSYHKKDLRPLSANGPQTQRLTLAGTQNAEDNKYKLHADTVRNTALSQVASQSGMLSDFDPLWLLYYKNKFSPVLDFNQTGYDDISYWYAGEMASLKERLNGARSADQDRGSRMIAYYRLLKEYQTLQGVWAIKTASEQKTLNMGRQQQRAQQGNLNIPQWTPNSDVEIAKKVLLNRKY
jgi:hypothetical protein